MWNVLLVSYIVFCLGSLFNEGQGHVKVWLVCQQAIKNIPVIVANFQVDETQCMTFF